MPRIIFHIDLDAFFASVEQRDNPSLKGGPVIIGADPKGGKGRGVVSTCSYEARAFGIHSAMPISHAYRACPHGIYLKPDMEKYHQASEDVFKIFKEFSPDMQPISIDEAFLDVTGSKLLFGQPVDIAKKIKQTVLKETGLTVSAGTQKADAAWDFVIFATTNRASAEDYTSQTGHAPALRFLINNYLNNPDVGVFAEQALTARSWPQVNDDEIDTIFDDMIRSVIIGEMTVSKAINNTRSELTELIRR